MSRPKIGSLTPNGLACANASHVLRVAGRGEPGQAGGDQAQRGRQPRRDAAEVEPRQSVGVMQEQRRHAAREAQREPHVHEQAAAITSATTTARPTLPPSRVTNTSK